MGPVVIVPLIVAGVGSIVTAITIKLNKLQKR
jgi:hypothetical protein